MARVQNAAKLGASYTNQTLYETGRELEQTTHKAQVQPAIPDRGILVGSLYAVAVPSKRGSLYCVF